VRVDEALAGLLDLEGAMWLVDYLKTYPATVVVITAKFAGRKVFGLATAGVRLA